MKAATEGDYGVELGTPFGFCDGNPQSEGGAGGHERDTRYLGKRKKKGFTEVKKKGHWVRLALTTDETLRYWKCL